MLVVLLAGLALLASPAAAHGQVFFATRPNPEFMIGPLFVRAHITPALGDTATSVQFSVVVPATRSAADVEQDLFLLWPGAVAAEPGLGPPDRTLAKAVEEHGFTVLERGRTPFAARNLYQRGPDGRSAHLPILGGAPFVTFVRESGAHGLTSPATYIRIPWTPQTANRAWLMDLRLTAKGFIKAKPSTWFERTFWGERYQAMLSFHDVQQRGLFPLYFWNRDRVLKLSEDPSQLIMNFAQADTLKIDELHPESARRQLSESLENTEVVSLFLDRAEGLRPQTLTVQFGYFSGWQSWAPVLIPTLFFALGNLAGPIILGLVRRVGRTVSARVHIGRGDEQHSGRAAGVVVSREALARIVPGETTYDQVLRLLGDQPEEQERLDAPDRKRLVYRGRRVVPHRRRSFGWLATVDHWDAEDHEVAIELERDVVRDVQAQVRRTRLAAPEPA